MKVTITETGPARRLLTISGDEADLGKIKKHALEILQPKVSAPGFRKGKVPLNVVEKRLGDEAVQSEVLEEAVNHLFSETIIERKLRVLERPQITLKKFVPYSSIEFTAEVEVVPEVDLGDYTKIRKKPARVKVTDKDIDDVIDNLRLRLAKKVKVTRSAQTGDEMIIDFTGKDAGGIPLAGASGTDYPIRLGSQTFIPGFEDELVGLKSGDEKAFGITFPKNYGHQPLAGQKAAFWVQVKSVLALTLPEVTDSFAAQVGPFKSLDSLREDIRSQLLSQKMHEADNRLKDEILEELVKKSMVITPDILVEDQIKHLREDFLNNLTYRGLTLEQYLNQSKLSEDEWLKAELKPQAVRRVQVGLVLSRVAEAEGLSVGDEELDQHIALLKNRHQDDKNRSQFDTLSARRDAASRLLTEKTLDKLISYSVK